MIIDVQCMRIMGATRASTSAAVNYCQLQRRQVYCKDPELLVTRRPVSVDICSRSSIGRVCTCMCVEARHGSLNTAHAATRIRRHVMCTPRPAVTLNLHVDQAASQALM